MRLGMSPLVVIGCGAMFSSVLLNMLAFQSPPETLAGHSATVAAVSAGRANPDLVPFLNASPATGGPARFVSDDRGERALWRAVQQELTRKGYRPGNSEGVTDIATRAALLAYEFDHGLALTAKATPDLLQTLTIDVPRAPGLGPSRGGPEAQTLIRTVQDSLNRLGLDAGPVDGELGPRTRRAIERFEKSQGLPIGGRISAPVIQALGSRSVSRQMSAARPSR